MSSMSAFNTDDVRRTWQEKYDKLQQENERLHEDNERLSARVVSLSQGEYQITDDKITKKYREIRDGIDLWIDELQDGERRDFRTNYQAVLKHKDRENMFHDLGFKAGCLDEKWEEQLGRLETCIYVILGMVIAQLLKNEIFLRNYPAGVTETQIRVLDKIHNAMVSSPQSKDEAKFYKWRGEALSALATTADFKKYSKEVTEKLVDIFRKDIISWLGQRLSTKLEVLLREKIIQPAVDFQAMITCSGKKFNMQYTNLDEKPLSELVKNAEVINISEWRVSRGDIRGVFHCWLPALVMTIAVDQNNVTFADPLLLGYKASNLEPRRSGTNSLMKQPGLARERAPQESKQRNSRNSTSKISKSDAPSSSKKGSFLSTLLPSLSNRSESGPSRKGSQGSALPISSNRNISQAPPPEPSHANTLPPTIGTLSEVYSLPGTGGRSFAIVDVSPTRRTFPEVPLEEEPLSDIDSSLEVHDGMDEENRTEDPGSLYANPRPYEYHKGHSHQ